MSHLVYMIGKTLKKEKDMKSDVKKVTLDSSLRLLQYEVEFMDATSKNFILLNHLFCLFLICIDMFKDLETDYIKKSVLQAHSILDKWMNSKWKNPFGATSWSKNIAELEIKVL